MPQICSGIRLLHVLFRPILLYNKSEIAYKTDHKKLQSDNFCILVRHRPIDVDIRVVNTYVRITSGWLS